MSPVNPTCSAGITYTSPSFSIGLDVFSSNGDIAQRSVSLGGSLELQDHAQLSATCLVKPSLPWASVAGGKIAWDLIHSTNMNHFGVVNHDALTNTLRLHAKNKENQKCINAIERVSAEVAVERMSTNGRVGWVEGTTIEIHMSQSLLNCSPYVFGSVLNVFFQKHAAINSFTKLGIRTEDAVFDYACRLGGLPIC